MVDRTSVGLSGRPHNERDHRRRRSFDRMQYFGYRSSEEAMEAAKQLEELSLDSAKANPVAAPGGTEAKVRQESRLRV